MLRPLMGVKPVIIVCLIYNTDKKRIEISELLWEIFATVTC
jgi:hypothetical protein